MRIKKEKIIIIVIGVVVIGVLVVYLFLYNPLIGSLRLLHTDYTAIKEKLSSTRNLIDRLAMIDRKRHFIGQEDIALAIDELVETGKANGINFVSMTPKKIEDSKDSYKILPIEIELESTYKDLGTFLGVLDELEKSLVTVRDFKVVSGRKKLNAELVIDIYLKETN